VILPNYHFSGVFACLFGCLYTYFLLIGFKNKQLFFKLVYNTDLIAKDALIIRPFKKRSFTLCHYDEIYEINCQTYDLCVKDLIF
jgi:NADH dehydrogenase